LPTWTGRLFPPEHTTVDKAHGRLEIRNIRTSTELTGYLAFPYAAQVFSIQRNRTEIVSQKERTETVYGITSLTPLKADPGRLLRLARGQWSIENRLHYVRDVTYDEDRCRVRKGCGAQVMASLRNLAISLLRMAGARYIASALRFCSRLGLRVLRLIGVQVRL
jgi:predicted transposase YbfD/YdcC